MRSSGIVAVAGLVVGLGAGASRAQDTRTVAAGPQYEAGGFHEVLFGKGYRDLWTTPIEVPVLDLRGTGGGLTPVRIVGQAQGLGLAFKGNDGRAYTFRSLHKHPERMLPEEWRERFPAKIAQDQSSHTHPAAGQILASLQEAVGVAHTDPKLVVVPDDPALGKFQKQFAGEFGTIDEFPLPAADGRPGFLGATAIVSTSDLWGRWLEGPENHVDSRAFLRARVLDLWLDNFDRHRGQWRWMRIPGRDLWQPLPEDPDMVLVRHDGLMMRAMRGRVPKELKFSAKYPRKLEGPLANCFEVDRWLLSDLDAAAWREVATEVQGRLTDDVVEGALRRMPAPWYAKSGSRTLAELKARRAGLVDYVLRVYRYYARAVDVHATDRAELVTIARQDDGSVELSVAGAEPGAAASYRRRFLPAETDEVRVYLHGGDDRVTRTGAPGGPLKVRVVAGGGQDAVDDSKSGGTDVWRDAGEVNVARGSGTQVRGGAWTNPSPVKDAPWLEPRSYGHRTIGGAVLAYHPDIEGVLGYGLTRTGWGFRTAPASSVQVLRAAITTGAGTGKVEYSGTFRRTGTGAGFRFETFASDIEQINFFGYGNDTKYPIDPTDPDQLYPGNLAYRAQQKVLFASPTLRFDLGRRFETFVGPEVRYSDTKADDGSIIGASNAYGTGRFGQIAVRGGVHFDSRQQKDAVPLNITEGILDDRGGPSTTGVNFDVAGFYVPKTWDVISTYGGVDGVVRAYAGSRRVHLAARVGGRRLWGDAPWFEAAAIGGLNNRGYYARRFTGDSSLFGSLSLRGWLGRLPIPLLPTRFGLVAFVDTGRVWLENRDSTTWHTSYGGGLLAQPVLAPVTVHAIVGHSKEGNRFYFGLGYPF
ncbi:MAG: hypothetical protein U0599_11915 [Vicinamibacteria bacterium]